MVFVLCLNGLAQEAPKLQRKFGYEGVLLVLVKGSKQEIYCCLWDMYIGKIARVVYFVLSSSLAPSMLGGPLYLEENRSREGPIPSFYS